MRRALKLLFRTLGLLLGVQLIVRIYLQLRPKITPPAVHRLLDSRLRRLYREPDWTLAPLQLQAGQRVLEIGGGTGLFTATAARLVQPDGHVISIEVQRGMLRHLVGRVRAAGVGNILVQQADAAALPLQTGSVDVVYLIAVLPMVPDKARVLGEIRRVLRPDGLLAVSEELLAPEYVSASVTTRWLRSAGFEVTATRRERWCYMVLARPAATAGDGRVGR